MTELRHHAADLSSTDQLGRALADVLPPGSVVALVGTLGAGKTHLVRSVAAALGFPAERVTSPTFVLVNQYVGGRLPVYHFDAYRLKDEDEFLQLGPEEYFDGNGLTFIEWADRVEELLPSRRVTIAIEVRDRASRTFTVKGNRDTQIVDRLQYLLSAERD